MAIVPIPCWSTHTPETLCTILESGWILPITDEGKFYKKRNTFCSLPTTQQNTKMTPRFVFLLILICEEIQPGTWLCGLFLGNEVSIIWNICRHGVRCRMTQTRRKARNPSNSICPDVSKITRCPVSKFAAWQQVLFHTACKKSKLEFIHTTEYTNLARMHSV